MLLWPRRCLGHRAAAGRMGGIGAEEGCGNKVHTGSQECVTTEWGRAGRGHKGRWGGAGEVRKKGAPLDAIFSCFVANLPSAPRSPDPQGFLPDEIDSFVQDKVYPSYTYIMLGFLGLSTVYGLFKIGKLPGQRQQP